MKPEMKPEMKPFFERQETATAAGAAAVNTSTMRRTRLIPLFFFGVLLGLFGLALYFFGMVFSVFRLLLGLGEPFRSLE